MKGRVVTVVALVLLAVAWPRAARAQSPYEFGSYPGYEGAPYQDYDTRSLYVPMEDGTRIAIDLSLPRGMAPGTTLPTIMSMTRYWRATAMRWPLSLFQSENPFVKFFTRNGYAVVRVDVRGTGASYGTWTAPYNEQEIFDCGRDLVQWVVDQPWSNHRVGAIGISYGGNLAASLPIPNHPAVKAVVPRFIEFDEYTDLPFPGGIQNRGFLELWERGNKLLDTNDVAGLMREFGGNFLGRLFVAGVKPVDNDLFGRQLREAVAQHATNINVLEAAGATTFRDDVHEPTGLVVDQISLHRWGHEVERSGAAYYLWGSWLDAGTANAVLHHFFSYDNPQRAAIGAWTHGGGVNADQFNAPGAAPDPSTDDQQLDCLRFLDHYLKGRDTGMMDERVLHYYTVGEGRWKVTSVWPPEGTTMQRWYLRAGHRLSPAQPEADEAADTYKVDFTATSGKTNRWYTQLGGINVVYDRRAEQTAKLLSYESPPLASDTEITGHPVVALQVRSTHEDGAFYAYLDAVAPDGTVIYVTDGQLRALDRKVRNDAAPYTTFAPYHTFRREDAMPLVPGEVAELTFGLMPTSTLIPAGYRLRLSIAGHDADNFIRIPAHGDPTITVEHDAAHASYVDLPIAE